MKNIQGRGDLGRGEGGLNREGGSLSFFPFKGKGGGLFETGRFREDLRQSFYNQQDYKNVKDFKGLLPFFLNC